MDIIVTLPGSLAWTNTHQDRLRALQWHCRGQRFDPVWLHHKIKDLAGNG
jgi:hypothetical protein